MERRRFLQTSGVAVAALTAGCANVIGGGGGGGSEPSNVSMTASQFEPRNLEVPPDTTVTWKNDSDVKHSVTAASDGWSTDETLQPGDVTGHRFGSTGTYDAYCRFHGSAAPLDGMSMRVGVGESIDDPLGNGTVVGSPD